MEEPQSIKILKGILSTEVIGKVLRLLQASLKSYCPKSPLESHMIIGDHRKIFCFEKLSKNTTVFGIFLRLILVDNFGKSLEHSKASSMSYFS